LSIATWLVRKFVDCCIAPLSQNFENLPRKSKLACSLCVAESTLGIWVCTWYISDYILLDAQDGHFYTCNDVNNAAAAGKFSPGFCSFIALFDFECGCLVLPFDDQFTCFLCPVNGVQNPYVFMDTSYFDMLF
jgi:hypothetical protein